MKRSILYLGFILSSLGAIGQGISNQEKLIHQIKHHKFRTIHRQFDENLSKHVSLLFLKKSFNALEKAIGTYHSHGKTKIIHSGKDLEYITPLYFKKGCLILGAAYNDKGQLNKFYLKRKAYSLPHYGQGLGYYKEDIFIESGKYKLPGEIIYPLNISKKLPLFIFVHGSGANDRYESDGQIQVFKDMYLGLVSQGFACLIYDKRTFVYKKQFDSIQFTLWDETVEDAINAFKLAKTKSEIDTNQIFIIGHSQGGYAIPLILKGCKGVKGAVSMAGCSRPLDVLLEYQYKYLANQDGKVSLAEKVFLRKEQKKIDFVRSEQFLTAQPVLKVLNYWPSNFWKDIKSYRPVDELKTLDCPVLFLQGDRDYQVTDDDLKLWKSACLEKKQWSFISYPKLNHRFIEGEGQPTSWEYLNGGNVPLYVSEDIALWLKTLNLP